MWLRYLAAKSNGIFQMKRKLVILTPFLTDFKVGGTPIRIAGYTCGLEQYIADYTFVAPVRPDYVDEKHFFLSNIHHRWSKVILLHNLLHKYCKPLAWLFACIIDCFSGIRSMENLITENTILWSHQDQVVAFYFHLTRRTAMIYDVHGFFDIQREYREGLSMYRKLWFDMYCKHEEYLLRKSNYVNVVSKEMRDYVQQRFTPKGKILIAPDGIPQDLKCYKAIQPIDLSTYRNEGRRIALFAGSFKPIGGVVELLQEFLADVQLSKQFTLLLIGRGPDQNRMENLLAKYPNAPVSIIPPMPHKELVGYMKAADVIICPDPIENKYNQITPHIKLYDAVASGTPVVATRINVNEHLFPEGERVMYYNYGDGSFAKAMIAALYMPHEINNNLHQYTYAVRLQQYIEMHRDTLNL